MSLFEINENVGLAERATSLAVGCLMVAAALGSKRSVKKSVLSAGGGALLFRGLSGYCPMYGSLGLDTTEEGRLAGKTPLSRRRQHVRKSVTIGCTPMEVYNYCRQMENLEIDSKWIKSIEPTGEGYRWSFKTPVSGRFSMNLRITEDRPGELLAWQSAPGAVVDAIGSFTFKGVAEGSETILTIDCDYYVVGGILTAAPMKLLQPVVEIQVKEIVRRVKAVLEVGEVATIEGQPTGKYGRMVELKDRVVERYRPVLASEARDEEQVEGRAG